MKGISDIKEFYGFIDAVILECRAGGTEQIARKLEDAKDLGSSGLEIVGAIGQVLRDDIIPFSRNLSADTRVRVSDAIAFVDRCYGRTA